MLDLRWVANRDGDLQLQFRTRGMRVDANGAFCDFDEWTDWAAVPIVHFPERVLPTVDVFDP